MQEEAASADVEAAASYPGDLAQTVNEGGCAEQQIFSVEVTALYWEKMVSGTFVAGEERSVPAFKTSQDKLTLVRGQCS